MSAFHIFSLCTLPAHRYGRCCIHVCLFMCQSQSLLQSDPTSVLLIGHSLGGIVARAFLALPSHAGLIFALPPSPPGRRNCLCACYVPLLRVSLCFAFAPLILLRSRPYTPYPQHAPPCARGSPTAFHRGHIYQSQPFLE